MNSIIYILPFIFLVYSLSCSIVFGKVFQLKLNYNIKSISSTLVLGIPLYLTISMIAMIPTILINFTGQSLSYYLYTFIGLLFLITIGLAIYNRKLFKWNWIEILILCGTILIVSIILILANSHLPLEENNRILNNITDTSLLGENFIINEYSFCWVRYLSGWVSLAQVRSMQFIELFIQFGVYIFFGFFLTSVLFSIGENIMRIKHHINYMIAPVLSIIVSLVFALTNLDIVTGFLIPLFVLLTTLSLFFYTINTPIKTRSLKLFIGVLFFLAFLLDYNTWGISFVLMLALVLYQGYKERAIDLWSFLVWFLANMINVIIVFSNSMVTSIILLVITGGIVAIIVRYLSGNVYARRFRLERNMWRYEILLTSLTFLSLATISIIISKLTINNSISQWLNVDFWGNINLVTLTQNKIILIFLALILILIGIYGFYFFWFNKKPKKNIILIIVAIYIVFFFNPLVTPIYNLARTKELYSFGFIFFCSLLVISILNFFSDMESIKGNKFLALFPILLAVLFTILGYFVFKQIMYFTRNSIYESIVRLIKPKKNNWCSQLLKYKQKKELCDYGC